MNLTNEQREKVKIAFCEKMFLEPEDIEDDVDFYKKHNIDSLDFIEFVVDLELQFGIQIDDRKSDHAKTINDVYKLIEEA